MIKGARPSRQAKTCRKMPLHWKRTMKKMIDALFKSEMIKKVQGETGEAILVLKPRDTTGPSRMVVDYPPLKYCFNRNAFK